MKILFIWDVAGVSCINAKWLRRLGHEVTVISRTKLDDLHFLDFYGETSLDIEGPNFDIKAHYMASDYDIIHVNCIPYIAARIKRSYPNKKVVLQYHGSDARTTTLGSRIEYEHIVDAVIVSTRDLMDHVDLKKPVTHIPNPIDIEHFKPSEHNTGAVFIKAQYYHLPTCIPFDYTVRDRALHPLLYSEMPEFFKGFDTYVDIKNYEGKGPINAPSKTSLEALATGMRVYSYERKYLKGLPPEHNPNNTVKLLEELYKSI